MLLWVEVFRYATFHPFFNSSAERDNFAFFLLQQAKRSTDHFTDIAISTIGDPTLNELLKVISERNGCVLAHDLGFCQSYQYLVTGFLASF